MIKEKNKRILFYIFFFLFILAISTMNRDYDPDLWARLIAGMGFVQTGNVLKHDFLSYTPTHIWYDHEWGSSIIFYLTQHIFSYTGLLFLQVILAFLIVFFMIKTIELRGVKTTGAYNFLFYVFAYITFATINNSIRCQMFSFLFFTIFLFLMERERKGVSKKYELITVVTLIMFFWNNMHGGCVSGVGLITIYIVGEFLNKKPVKKYIFALIASLVVLPLNPWGLGYLNFLYHAVTMNRLMIIEWDGLFDFNWSDWIQFKILALILLGTGITEAVRQFVSKQFIFDKTKFLVIIVTLFFAIKHVKLIPFAVISMSCFLYDDFYTLFNILTQNIFEKCADLKESIVYTVTIVFVIFTIQQNGFGPCLSLSRYPFRAVEFIKINKIKGNLLQDFELGSYISYKLYPQNKIFMDGRFEEVYNTNLLFQLNSFLFSVKSQEKFFNSFPSDVLLLDKTLPVYQWLKKDYKWKKIFDDNKFVVFVSYKKLKNNYKIPSNEINYYKKDLFSTNIEFTEAK